MSTGRLPKQVVASATHLFFRVDDGLPLLDLALLFATRPKDGFELALDVPWDLTSRCRARRRWANAISRRPAAFRPGDIRLPKSGIEELGS